MSMPIISPLALSRAGNTAVPTANRSGGGGRGTSAYTAMTNSISNQAAVESSGKADAFRNTVQDRMRQGQAETDSYVARVKAQRSKFQKDMEKKRAPVGSFKQPTGPVPGFTGDGLTDTRRGIIEAARSRLGTPYAWGGGGAGIYAGRGTGKGTQNVVGVDCSGLTSWVYSKFGINMPRQSDQQLRTMGVKTAVSNARPGDLIGWNKGGHVAIYAGNGYIIESPKPGGKVQYRRVPAGTFAVRLSLPGD